MPIYDGKVAKIKKAHGDFILVNTNYNQINGYGPDMNLFKPVKGPVQSPLYGRAARGMSREYAEGLRDHKLAVFEHFKKLIPELEKAFQDYNIVVRPHPTENTTCINILLPSVSGYLSRTKAMLCPG